MLPLKSARLIIALAVVLFGATGMGVAQTEATLHRFENKGDGYSPIAGVIADSEGNLYGAASDDFSDSGTIFKMTPPAPGGRWIYSALYKMNGKTDGDTPWASLLRDSSGNLYGTADAGGAHSCGTVFELTPPTASGAPWTFSLLYTFAGGTDGCATEGADLVADNLGNLYGVTGGGGKCSAGCNEGVVYRLSPPTVAGAAWTETVLYRFGTGGANDSAAPICTLLRMGEALYGTTFAGGVYGAGTVFVLQPPSASGKPWTEQVLYSFTGGTSDGLKPQAGLISDGRGGIYGTTADNYAFVFATCAGTYCGHVFDLNPPSGEGEPWTYTSVWAFSGPDGSTPYAPVARDNSGQPVRYDLIRRQRWWWRSFQTYSAGGRWRNLDGDDALRFRHWRWRSMAAEQRSFWPGRATVWDSLFRRSSVSKRRPKRRMRHSIYSGALARHHAEVGFEEGKCT